MDYWPGKTTSFRCSFLYDVLTEPQIVHFMQWWNHWQLIACYQRVGSRRYTHRRQSTTILLPLLYRIKGEVKVKSNSPNSDIVVFDANMNSTSDRNPSNLVNQSLILNSRGK